MEPTKHSRHRVASALSDEELARVLASDFEHNPSEFGLGADSIVSDSATFLKNTSARGIEPMKRWL